MSILHFRSGLLALALVSLQACQKFSKSFQEKAFTCGIDPDQYQDPSHLLQIVDENNEPLSAARLQSLQVGLRQGSEWQNLNVSRGGCVVVDPSSPGEIVAQDPVREESVWLSLASLETGFQRVALNKRRAFSMRFSCPATEYAADEKLDLNAFYAGDGEAKAGLWLGFAAQKWNEGKSALIDEAPQILWDAAIGQKSFPQTLSMETLSEGTYKLTARAGYLKPGQSLNDLEILGSPEGCTLRILRDLPKAPQWRLAANALENAAPLELVVPVRQTLDVIKDPDHKLEFCVEALAGNLNSCEPQQRCKGPDAVFTETDDLSITEAGNWAVFVRSRDAAQHVSALTCARVQASNSAPRFSVSWKEAEWNQPFPLLTLPPAQLEAEVTDLQHDILGVKFLEESLECRVTVTSALGNSRDAYYSRCLGERCEGRPFRGWQPCSSRIAIDMSQEWLRSENWESSVSLHVRASDQAGHAYELRKNLWFSGQRLINKAITHPVSGEPISFSQLLKKHDGTLLATADGHVLEPAKKGFAQDSAVATMIGTRTVRQHLLVEDKDGVALWGFWTFYDEKGSILGKKTGGRWIFQPNADQGGPAQSCEAFGQSHQGSLLCLNSQNLAKMDAQHRWQSLSLLDPTGKNWSCDASIPMSSRYTETAEGRWLICNAKTLLFQKNGQDRWQALQDSGTYLTNFRNIYATRRGELWILGDQGTSKATVFVLKASVWDNRSAGLEEPWFIREEESPTYDLHNFHEMEDGSLRFGVQRFDASQNLWRSMLPDTLQKYEGVAQDQSGGLWTVVEDKALLRFHPKPLILPLEMLDLLPGSRLVSLAVQGPSVLASFVQTGHILYRGSAGLFHLETQPWQNLPFGFVRTPAYGEAWTQWFKDPKGQMLVLREDGEIARLDAEQGWTVVSLPSDRPLPLKKNFTLIQAAQHVLAQAENGLVWLWDYLSFKDYPWSAPDGFAHKLRSATVDGLGQIWEARQDWRKPLQLYRLQDQTWETYNLPQSVASCTGPLHFFEGDKIILSCGTKGPTIIYNQKATFLADLYPELPWTRDDVLYWTVPTTDKNTPYLFFTVYDDATQEQTLHRFQPGTGEKKQWKLIDDRRLHFRGDMMTSYVRFDSLVLDPHAPERFLISSFRYILRPEGDTLKLAMDGQRLLTSRGLPEEVMSGIILGLDIQRRGEVWILMRELGLIRYDLIWQAEDKDDE